jgi:transposase
VAVAYEAEPTGFGLWRALTTAGIRCMVITPVEAATPGRGSGQDRRQRRLLLARLLRLDMVTAVSVPTDEQEAARDLVRARDTDGCPVGESGVYAPEIAQSAFPSDGA